MDLTERKKGPVEILCKEIGVRFTADLETPKVLAAFVRVLHGRLEHMYWISSEIDRRCARPVNCADARRALDKLTEVLKSENPEALVSGAADIHALIDSLEWRGTWASHVFDIVSSLASALRFGLDGIEGISSRHAAAAASHLWKHEYGISKFDEYTGEWEKTWAREQFYEAVKRLALSPERAAGIA
jgi:hypothetical protein